MKLVKESLNEIMKFERTDDPLKNMDIGKNSTSMIDQQKELLIKIGNTYVLEDQQQKELLIKEFAKKFGRNPDFLKTHDAFESFKTTFSKSKYILFF